MGTQKANLTTHRCEGSLRQRASIRYLRGDAYTWRPGWYIHEYVDDWDYCVKYMRRLFPIRYCPFCGQAQRHAEDAHAPETNR